jgi:hypothetical protein
MKVSSLVIALCLVAVRSQAADHHQERNWESGKLLDSRTSRESVETGASTTGTITDGGPGSSNVTLRTRIEHMNIKSTELLLVGKEFAFILNHSTFRTWDGKPGLVMWSAVASLKHGCRFVIGDDVQYSQDKGKLYVVDADGKTCKLDIVRQERLTN